MRCSHSCSRPMSSSLVSCGGGWTGLASGSARPCPLHDRVLQHLVETAGPGELFLAAQRDQDIGEVGDDPAAVVAAQAAEP